jgi:O-antigen/teichoic acid export membrane protein
LASFKSAVVYVAAMIIIKSLAGLAALKVQASFLLPAGFAVLSQFATISGLVTNISNAAVTTGMTVLLARAEDSFSTNRIIRSGQVFSLGLSCIISIGCVIMFFYETRVISISPLPRYLFLILAAAPWLITQSSIVQARLTSSFQLNRFSKLSNGSVIGVALLIISLTFYFGLTGSALAVAIGPMLTAIILLWFAAEKYQDSGTVLPAGSRIRDIVELFRYAAAMLVSICAIPLSHILIRESLLNSASAKQAGFWSGTVRVSDIYMQFFGMLLIFYILPKIASQTKDVDSRRLFFRYLGLLALLAMAVLALVYVLRGFIVMLALAPEFRPVIGLLRLQLLGDFFRIVLSFFFWFSYGQNLRILAAAEEVLQALLFYLFFSVIINRIDAQGAVVAHCFASMTNVVITGLCLLFVLYRRGIKNGPS